MRALDVDQNIELSGPDPDFGLLGGGHNPA